MAQFEVMEFLEKNRLFSFKESEISNELGLNRKSVNRNLKRLLNAGSISCIWKKITRRDGIKGQLTAFYSYPKEEN